MPKLLELLRTLMRVRHYSMRTEEAYAYGIKQYIFFHQKRHPTELGADEVTAFLSHLAVQRQVAAATQNQALAAILFLYRQILKQDLPWLENVERAKRPARLPLVLTRDETANVLAHLKEENWLMASLLDGSGLRLRECLRLRVKDIDFDYQQIIVREGKGDKDRHTVLPASTVEPLQRHLRRVKAIHLQDLRPDLGGFTCRKRWRKSIRTHLVNGSGNTFSRRRAAAQIQGRELSAANTSANGCYRKR